MFWDKGYAPSQNIEELLEKENVTVEEFLDEDDILQECKTLKKSIVNYFTRPEVIRRLVELITTEPSEDLPLTQRFRHANMACEILTLGIPSLDEKLLSDADTLQLLYSYLENEPPLNPLLSSFFSKTFSMLFTKKTEQDWFLYQQMCLKLLEHIKTQNNFLDLICKHFSTPVVPELILQMMRVDGGDIKRNLYEWLTEEKLVERLIGILGSSQEFEKHENVAEFLCDLLEHGRGMRQAEQEDGSFEPAFNGSNPILQNLESEATIEALLNVILHPDAKPSSIISGISVVLTLLSPGSFMDEPNSERLKFIQVREKEINEQIVSTVIRVIAPRLKHFNELLKNPPKKPELVINAGTLNDPFGNTRLQVCRLFTVLLQTKKLEVTEAICETDFFETVMALFQKYCWNNFLHCEVEKYFETIFCYALSSGSNSNNNSTHASDGSYNGRNMNSSEKLEDFDKVANFLMTFFDKSCGGDNKNGGSESENKENEKMDSHTESTTTSNTDENMANEEKEVNELKKEETKEEKELKSNDEMEVEQEQEQQQNEQEIEEKKHSETTETETTKTTTTETETTESIALAADDATNQIVTPPDGATQDNEPNGPFLLQKHLIVECKIISKLLACWLHNAESEKSTNRRRLGYMGHLLKILKHLRNCISESEHISALIESNLTDAAELELWQNIMKQDDGELTKAQATQCRLLANCNPHDVAKGFCADNQDVSWTYSQNWDSQLNDDSAIANPYAYDAENFLRNRIDDDDDDDNNEDNSAVVGGTVGSIAAHQQPTARIEDIDNLIDQLIFLTADNIMEMPAGATNRIAQQTSASTTLVEGIIPPPVDAWADFGNEEFADFDAHFDSFASDMGESFSVSPTKNKNVQPAIGTAPTTNATKKNDLNFDAAKDNNANLEKMTAFVVDKCVNAVVGDENKFSDDEDDDDEDEDVIVHIVQNDDDDDGNNGDRMKGFYQSNSANAVDDDFDDFDDDEGMWTKPLGGGFSDGDNANDNNTPATTTTNGPPQLSTVPPTNDLGSIWLDAVNTKQLNIANSKDLNVDIKNNIPNTSNEQQQSAVTDATTGVVSAAVVDSSSSTTSSTKQDTTKDATTPPTVVN